MDQLLLHVGSGFQEGIRSAQGQFADAIKRALITGRYTAMNQYRLATAAALILCGAGLSILHAQLPYSAGHYPRGQDVSPIKKAPRFYPGRCPASSNSGLR
jgi:hypothetical protein